MTETTKIDLIDVSFLIPVCIDSHDRMQNLEIIIAYLNKYFHTAIQVLEVDQHSHSSQYAKENSRYVFHESEGHVFRRTRINNKLIHYCSTPIAVLYDTDVIIPPEQLIKAANEIRKKQYAFALPYDGRFLQVDYHNKRLFKNTLDIDFLTSGANLFTSDTNYSVGGCFMFNVNTYKTCGMENEHIEGWGHDDAERVKRLKKLGYEIFRPNGPLYHLWHNRSQNSYFFDEAREIKSFETYFKTCAITKEEMEEEIATWPWIKPVNKINIATNRV